MSPMQILVDARGTQEGFKQHKQRGIGHYALNLLERLPKYSNENHFTYLTDGDNFVEDSLRSSNIDFLQHRTFYFIKHLSKYFEPQFSLPRTLRKQHFDLIHYLAHEDAALFSPHPFIVTIHDMLRFGMQDKSSSVQPMQRVKNIVTLHFSKHIINRASFIITDSEHSKRDIMNLLQIPDDKIRVVYLGVDENYFNKHPQSEIDRIRVKYKLPNDLLLYVGGIDERKNIPNVFKALSILYSDQKDRPPLAFVGKIANQKEYPRILELRARLNLEKKILLLGFIPEDELQLIYSVARAFIFPSLYEGFGLPILQSMATGTPVVTSKLSSIPEIGGDAVHYIDPHNPISIADGIRAILDNKEFADKLAAKGNIQARKFSWDKTARDTVHVYLEVIERLRSAGNLRLSKK